MSKILVVDDEPDVEQLIRQRFRRRIRAGEIECLFAANGVEALEAVRSQPDIDIVLTDINMPRMDGLTLLDHLKEFDPQMKAVVVSAYGDMKNIRTAMNRGAFDFITKPIDFGDLEVTLEKTLSHLELIREALSARDGLVAIHRELEVAADIQKSLLPTRFPQENGHSIHATMIPAKEVAGDFYDFFHLDQDRIGFAVGDVSGKGMAAALFMAVARTLLRASATNGLEPGACLSQVNQLLCVDNDSCMFVTLFYGVIDTGSGEVVYANAGHCPPLLSAAAGDIRSLETTGGMALGIVDGLDYTERRITLDVGDSLLLYTDGVTEAFDGDGGEFGEARLLETLGTCGGLGPADLLQRVTDAVARFAGGAEQSDDITCLAIRRDAAEAGTRPEDGDHDDRPRQAGASRFEIELVNQLSEIQRLAQALEEFGDANGLGAKAVMELNLVLEELFTNTISYGYDDDEVHTIVIRVALQGATLSVEFEDDGKPFDPLTAPAADIDASLEDRAIGGLGIHFAKTLMDRIDYAREDGRNRLRMTKSV